MEYENSYKDGARTWMKQEGGLTTWLCFRILTVRTRQHLLSTAFYNFNHFPPYYKHKYILTRLHGLSSVWLHLPGERSKKCHTSQVMDGGRLMGVVVRMMRSGYEWRYRVSNEIVYRAIYDIHYFDLMWVVRWIRKFQELLLHICES